MQATTQNDLARKIMSIKEEKGLTYQQLVSYLNDNSIFTIQGKPWKFQNLAGFIQTYGANAGNKGQAVKAITKKARTVKRSSTNTRRAAGRGRVSSDLANFTSTAGSDTEKVSQIILASQMPAADKLFALRYVVTHV